MDSKLFSGMDYYDLVAMQRVFREAKFCPEPSDEEISASPIVSKLYKRLIAALIDADVARKGDDARANWTRWLDLDESREEWRIALVRAQKERLWTGWNENQRLDYVRDLLSPFEVSEGNLKKFVASVVMQVIPVEENEVVEATRRTVK